MKLELKLIDEDGCEYTLKEVKINTPSSSTPRFFSFIPEDVNKSSVDVLGDTPFLALYEFCKYGERND